MSVTPESEKSDEDEFDLGFHVIAGDHLLEMLRRCEQGEAADLVFAELWANAEHIIEDA